MDKVYKESDIVITNKGVIYRIASVVNNWGFYKTTHRDYCIPSIVLFEEVDHKATIKYKGE